MENRKLHPQLINGLIIASMIFLISSGVFIQISGAELSSSSKTIVVPDDYSTINVAVQNSNIGDTILVKNGTYFENVVVDRSLIILGENSANTTVVGEGGLDRGARAVFTLMADDITVSGLTIKSVDYSSSSIYATGICIEGDRCTISENNVIGTFYGVFCSINSGIVISNNDISEVKKDAVRIIGGSMNIVSENNIFDNAVSGVAIDGYSNKVLNNIITGNGRGVGIGASYSLVFGNNIYQNTESGIYFAASHSIISGNQISESKYGIYFTPFFAVQSNNKIYNNNFVDNSKQIQLSSEYDIVSWDNNYPSGGNFWSDYNGIDVKTGPDQTVVGNDGLGDTPYTINEFNRDNYPLTTPIDMNADKVQPTVAAPPEIKSNSKVAQWNFDEVNPNGVTEDLAGNNPLLYGPDIWSVSSDRVLTNGRTGKAFSFNGTDYAYASASPSLDIAEELTIEAWINAKEFKEVDYNNIVVECLREFAYPTRIWGLAINGEIPKNDNSIPQGALRGFIVDKNGITNEVATTKAVVTTNQWIHVVFTRSLDTGLKIFVNNEEQPIKVVSGVQNPSAPIKKGNELYVGHDSVSTIDEVSIRNFAIQPETKQNGIEWIVGGALIAVAAILIGIIYLVKRQRS